MHYSQILFQFDQQKTARQSKTDCRKIRDKYCRYKNLRFSGMKDSLFGVLHGQGKEAIRFFTENKVVIQR